MALSLASGASPDLKLPYEVTNLFREIEIVSSLPKTRSGKIMRRVLKAKELGQNPGDISTLEE